MTYILIFLMLFTTSAMADVYVVTAPDKSVYSLSEYNDAVVPKGYKVDIIKNAKIDTLGLVKSEKFYDFNGGKFTINNTKVQAEAKQIQDAEAQRIADEQARQSAIAKLKGLGLNDNEIDAITGGN